VLKLRHVLNGMVAVLRVRMRVVMAMMVVGVVRVLSRSFMGGRVDHKLEGVPGGGANSALHFVLQYSTEPDLPFATLAVALRLPNAFR